MFGDSNSKIGTRELFALITFVIGIKCSDTTPTLLFKASKGSAWIMALFSGLVAIIPTLITVKVISIHKNLGLMDIVERLMGKKMNFVIGMLIFYELILSSASNSRSYVDILSDIYYQRSSIILLFAILMVSSYMIAKHGLEGIGRTAWIMLPYIALAFYLYIILLLNQMHPEFLYPIGGSGMKAIMKGSLENSTIYVELIILTIFIPYIRDFKSFKIGGLLGLAYSIFLVTLGCLVYQMIFDYPPTVIINYPFHTAARIIYMGRFVGNLEAFFLLFWLVSAILRYSFFIYASAAYFSYSLGIKDFRPMLLPCAALILIIGMIPENFYKNIEIIRRFFLVLSVILYYSLPIVLLILSKTKRGAENEA